MMHYFQIVYDPTFMSLIDIMTEGFNGSGWILYDLVLLRFAPKKLRAF